MPEKGTLTIRVKDDDCGKRLDFLVASLIPECSRSLAARLIQRGRIRVQGVARKPGYRVKRADELLVQMPPPERVDIAAEPIEINIVYEDKDIAVIDKPAGMVVHPAPGHYAGTVVNALLYHCPDLEGIGGELRPGIVHRLDKDTSGALVVVKNQVAQQRLADQFKSRTVRKEYLALVYGSMQTASGTITLPIGRHPVDRKKMSTRSRKGRSAQTSWRVRECFGGITLLRIRLKTGRTHQIRVHCAAMHHPIVGDPVYGGRKAGKGLPPTSEIRRLVSGISRQMLHAWRVAFAHPDTGKPMCFECPMPPDMSKLLDALRSSTAPLK